jgi:hypothetical protein
MTEYELMDSIVSFNGAMQSWVSHYITGLFAYLVTAYFVGARLTRSQTIIISSAFVAFVFLAIFAVNGAGNQCLAFKAEIIALNPNRIVALTQEVLWLALVIMMLGILVSLKFMWDVRHPETE